MNSIMITGHITKDPEIKLLNENKVATFCVAVRKEFSKDKGADFINCVAWSKTADFIEMYVHKGTLLGVTGRIQTRQYDDKDGKRVYVTEVVAEKVELLGKKEEPQTQYVEDTSEELPF